MADNSGYQVLAPDPEEHGDEMIDLMAKVFSGGKNYYFIVDRCREHFIFNSHYDWKVSRVGFLDDRLVTHFGVWDFRMRVGAAAVRCAGVGAVATHGQYRRRGLMADATEDSIAAMKESGYDISLLSGIPNFYHKFGYVPCWPSAAYIIQTKDLPSDEPTPDWTDEPARASEGLTKLYNMENARQTGTAIRPTYRNGFYWRQWRCAAWRREGSEASAPAGFIIYEKDAQGVINIADAVGDPTQALRAAGAVARGNDAEEVRFITLPERSAVARRLRRTQCRVETRYSSISGAMARIIRLKSCLEKLAKELSQRLAASPLAGWSGDLLLSDGHEEARLEIDAGKISVAAGGNSRNVIRGERLVRLILGSDAPSAILDEEGFHCVGEGRALAEALFPYRAPMLSMSDHF